MGVNKTASKPSPHVKSNSLAAVLILLFSIHSIKM
jgi:hypothetical protein